MSYLCNREKHTARPKGGEGRAQELFVWWIMNETFSLALSRAANRGRNNINYRSSAEMFRKQTEKKHFNHEILPYFIVQVHKVDMEKLSSPLSSHFPTACSLFTSCFVRKRQMALNQSFVQLARNFLGGCGGGVGGGTAQKTLNESSFIQGEWRV